MAKLQVTNSRSMLTSFFIVQMLS